MLLERITSRRKTSTIRRGDGLRLPDQTSIPCIGAFLASFPSRMLTCSCGRHDRQGNAVPLKTVAEEDVGIAWRDHASGCPKSQEGPKAHVRATNRSRNWSVLRTKDLGIAILRLVQHKTWDLVTIVINSASSSNSFTGKPDPLDRLEGTVWE